MIWILKCWFETIFKSLIKFDTNIRCVDNYIKCCHSIIDEFIMIYEKQILIIDIKWIDIIIFTEFYQIKTKFNQKIKISNVRIYLNEICKTTFSFETRFKKRQELQDYLFYNQLNLKTRILQRIHVNKHWYITLIV